MFGKNSFIKAVYAFTFFPAFFPQVKTFAVLLYAPCLLANTTHSLRSLNCIKCIRVFLNNLINDAWPYIVELWMVVASFAIATIAVLAWVKPHVPFPKHSQYSFRHFVFLQLHLKLAVSELTLLSSSGINFVDFFFLRTGRVLMF